jgi:hypothetical protein
MFGGHVFVMRQSIGITAYKFNEKRHLTEIYSI